MKKKRIILFALIVIFGVILFEPKMMFAKEESNQLTIESEFLTNSEGVASIAGKTVSNAKVTLKGSSVTSDADGNFTLKYKLKNKKTKKVKVIVKKDKKKYKKKVKIKASKEYLDYLNREKTLTTWVKDHTNSDLDTIIDDYNSIEDVVLKEKLSEQVADSDTTMFDKSVTVAGVVDEFVEGNSGFSKSSFIMTTENGNKVRVSARGKGNKALDVGETAEVTGNLGYPLTKSDEYLIREASVYIKID